LIHTISAAAGRSAVQRKARQMADKIRRVAMDLLVRQSHHSGSLDVRAVTLAGAEVASIITHRHLPRVNGDT
jgi:hypothetical protein